MDSIKEKKEEIIKLLSGTKREGVDGLIKFMEKSDYFEAPASTRFHGAYEGGLAEHSLAVYHHLVDKMTQGNTMWSRYFKESGLGPDSIAIIALLHDLCKANMYVVEYRNKKSYEAEDLKKAQPREIKKDNMGQFVWISAPTYTINEEEPLGHGDKSVIIAMRYIKLKPEEEAAIRWHMGFSGAKEEYRQLGAAMEKYPIVLAMHEADMEDSNVAIA